MTKVKTIWKNAESIRPQQVCRLREVRLLLTGNVRYANARLLVTLPHPAL